MHRKPFTIDVWGGFRERELGRVKTPKVFASRAFDIAPRRERNRTPRAAPTLDFWIYDLPCSRLLLRRVSLAGGQTGRTKQLSAVKAALHFGFALDKVPSRRAVTPQRMGHSGQNLSRHPPSLHLNLVAAIFALAVEAGLRPDQYHVGFGARPGR
jgi:hypothetical protein